MVSVRREEFDEEYSFGAKTYDVKLVTQLLKAIKFKDNAVFYCTSEGVKVTVEDMKCLQANSYLEASLFDEYRIKKKPCEDFVKFTANLSVLLDCLNILYNSSSSGLTALVISYKGEGSPVKLLMEDSGIMTDCKVRTLIAEPLLNFTFEPSRSVNKVVFFSEFFKEVLNDVDTTSDLLQIAISTEPPKFKLTTDGNGLISETDVPCDSEMVDAFYYSTDCQQSYKLVHIKPALRPLPGSLKVSIQIDGFGVLCLQYMIVNEEGQTCFVEYFCSPVYQLSENEMNNRRARVVNGIGAFWELYFFLLLKSLKISASKRTIRGIMWTGEEEGLTGAYIYLKGHKDELKTGPRPWNQIQGCMSLLSRTGRLLTEDRKLIVL